MSAKSLLQQLFALVCGLFIAGAVCAGPKVELQTSAGRIVLELDAERTPLTVDNFVDYARSGFYDGTIFHRVIDGFMIQGGGFEPGMRQKKTRAPVKNEADKGGRNDHYTVAMARTGDPHSATAQFFINVADNAALNYRSPTESGWGYCVFGKVVEGREVVDRIASARTGSSGFHQNVPKEDIVIRSAKILP